MPGGRSSGFPNTQTNTTIPNGLGIAIFKTFLDTIHTQVINMAKGGRGGAGRGTKPGRGGNKSRKSADNTGVPKRSGELGACKDLEDKMFILSVSQKSKDGDVFCKTLEAVVTYIGSHFWRKCSNGATKSHKDYVTTTRNRFFYRGKVESQSDCTSEDRTR